MMVSKVVAVEWNSNGVENPTCTGGDYPQYEATLENGVVVHGVTCRCGAGCSGTERLPQVGEVVYYDIVHVGRGMEEGAAV